MPGSPVFTSVTGSVSCPEWLLLPKHVNFSMPGIQCRLVESRVGSWYHAWKRWNSSPQKEKSNILKKRRELTLNSKVPARGTILTFDLCHGDLFFPSKQWNNHCDKSFCHTPEGKGVTPETQIFCRNLGWSVITVLPAVYRFKRGLFMSLSSLPIFWRKEGSWLWIQKSLPGGRYSLLISAMEIFSFRASNGTTIAIKASVIRQKEKEWHLKPINMHDMHICCNGQPHILADYSNLNDNISFKFTFLSVADCLHSRCSRCALL